MLKTIINFIKSFKATRHGALEAYIISKNPQSEAEVNYWVQEFYRRYGGWI